MRPKRTYSVCKFVAQSYSLIVVGVHSILLREKLTVHMYDTEEEALVAPINFIDIQKIALCTKMPYVVDFVGIILSSSSS